MDLVGDGLEEIDEEADAELLVVNTRFGLVAITVSELIDRRRVAVKNLGPILEGGGQVTGAALLGGGQVLVVLDPNFLGYLARRKPGAAAHRPRILVVDDSAGVRQLLSATLNGAGFEVEVAANAREAMLAMSRGGFEAMVIDFSMPRSNGVELVRAMRSADIDVPIVMVSGVATQEEKKAAWEAGVDAYLDKFDLRQGVLTSTLRRMIGLEEGVANVSALSMLIMPRGAFFLADTYVNPEPTADEIVGITLQARDHLKRFDLPARVALLSYSNFGSRDGDSAGKMREAYRKLTHGEPGFYAWFQAVTPIDVITRMQIGSRPAMRPGKEGTEGLRAVPWVYAWTQSRHLLSAWYGAGAGLEAAIGETGLGVARDAYAHWAFFTALVDDLETSLARADLDIAAAYEELAPADPGAFAARLREEFQRVREQVLAVKQASALLERDPTLQRAIELRNPYVDPINLLQVDLLRRWRESGRQDRNLFDGLLACTAGIAEGLQSTG